MSLLPKDYTRQENLIADCLDDLGLRYEQQYAFFPYTVDFYIPEIELVIEADGKYGHFRKRDGNRDFALSNEHGVSYILHIRDFTKERIKEMLWQELNKLSNVPLKSLEQKFQENLE
jgi:very-short-patch-repair endonuclease